ncbi:XRE family transcriptional regulator [Ferruginivarius sediminum]|uniref:XRE family transcriptional regulator n=2 Tax=Ferruginivarius sediminum TaxID=2661937 RepID=A0A369TE32_9PROT|nr:XRE family transcriptional regulator [Ferruginivarius sediminum]
MLKWSRDDLAQSAQVKAQTIEDFENEQRNTRASTLVAIRTAFESTGVTFTEDGGVVPPRV